MLDVAVQFPETLKKYTGVIENFKGARAAHDATMSLADLYFIHGNPSVAATYYLNATKSASSGLEKALSFSGLGYSLENAGNPKDALSNFEKALNLGEAGIKGDVLLAIARCYEALHDTTHARSTYDQILSQMPDTDAAKTAELRKAKL